MTVPRSRFRLAPPGVLTGALWLASLTSVLGTLALLRFPGEVTALLGRSLSWFIKVPTFVYLTVLPAIVWLVLRERVGTSRATAMLGWGSVVGLTAELFGTTTGWPFGVYQYTDFLRPQFFGHVPVLIPLSWFAMSVLAFWLACRVTDRPMGRVAFAATAMVGWDLALDPAMVAGWPVWLWSDPHGIYYGMPILNLVGWWVTSAVILTGYERLAPAPVLVKGWPGQLWILSAVLPLGLLVVRGLWLAAAIGAVGVAVPLVAVWVAARRTRTVAVMHSRAVLS